MLHERAQQCEVAEAESPVAFNCLDCGVELPIIDRQHLIDRLRSYTALQEGKNQGTPRARCSAQVAQSAETRTISGSES
jgi:hypothetical protein